MKKTLTFLSALALAACNSGGGSAPVAVVPNTPGGGDQEAYYANFKEYFDNVIKTGADGGNYTDFVETEPSWPAHGGYKHYVYKEQTSTGTVQHVVDEKEMQLVNYGMHDGHAYVHNREGVGENLYTPTLNTTFTGGTLAYLTHVSNGGGAPLHWLIKGDATYTYNPTHPELTLAFDDYYTFTIEQGDGNNSTVTISGENNGAGIYFNNVYNLHTGTYEASGTDANFAAEHFYKDGVQEVGGAYEMNFGNDGIPNVVGATTSSISITGAFGGSH